MSSADPSDTSPLNNSCLTKRKESASMDQVTAFKASGLQRFVQAAQLVVQKSSRRACQLFCCPVDARGPGPDAQLSEPRTPPAALTSPPSTILILNISNSTLIDCVIGPDSHAHTHVPAAAGSPPLTRGSALHAHDEVRCSCARGHQGAAQAPPPVPPHEPASVNIHGSHLNYVIIGDNNNMHVEHVTEAEAPLL